MTYPYTTLETTEIVEKGEAITNPTLRLMERLCLKCPVGMWGWGGWRQGKLGTEPSTEMGLKPLQWMTLWCPVDFCQTNRFASRMIGSNVGVIILGTYEGIIASPPLHCISRRPWSSQKDVAELPPRGSLVSSCLSPCEAWLLPVKESFWIHLGKK